ncbi:V-type ATP synthase subunit E [Candidatus Enterococcus mansonii]|uniref:V-type proton ATPase subunit E n=1 Tax=Candidatus Enterococcus mansonii TaxID=1834181 RepID=A0A242CK82_9ENTE|nr:hypothetical protein [Enterococcus sp. 4G2_DIV0659]OTO10646.1 hypothetical protein A5880_001330 [Enterococcus sp. 4G2_DIV0659]
MDAIEKIVEQILEKGQAEVEALQQTETQRIDQEFQEQEEALFLQESTMIKKNEVQADKAFKQKQNRQQLEIKQATLNKKQGYLEQLFSESIERMNHWTEVEFQNFAQQIIAQLPFEGEAIIRLGEFSKEKLTEQWLSEHSTEQIRLVLASETIAGVGGFVVAKAGIEYNFLFPILVQEVKKIESFHIAEMLFN